MTILLLAGSPMVRSRSTQLLHHVGDKLARLGHRHRKLSVRDLPAQALLHVDFANPDLQVALAEVAQAHAVVIATPVFKAAYSGVLKAFLDVLPQDGLAGKLVLPLATGGSQAHMLALDYALRPVLSALAARHVLPSIYATDAQIEWVSDNQIQPDPAIALRIDEGIERLSDSLAALRRSAATAFTPVPFAQVRCSV
jgi:FMN reductase